MKRNFLLLVFLLAQIIVFGQREVTGTIISESSSKPLSGVVVRVKGTAAMSLSDDKGKYRIQVPQGSDTLVFSLSSMMTKELPVGASNVLDVVMSEKVEELKGVVVTALGVKRNEKSVGYAISNVDGDAIRNSNQTNVINSLGGVVAGANVTQSSGTAGGSTRITLRGFTSLTGNNQALIVIDGTRVNNDEFSSEASTQGVANSNRGIDIDPNDIESVSVLKGGAASALYGIDGANGVVLITTKKGKQAPDGQKFSVTLGSSIGFSQVNKLPELQNRFSQGSGGVYNAPETGQSGSWGPDISTLSYDGATDYAYDKNGRIVLNTSPLAKTPVKAYDNMGTFFRTGITVKNNFGISGGNETFSFRFSGSNLRESGVVPKNTFEKTNLSFSTGVTLLDKKLKITTSTNYVNSGGVRIQQGSNTSGVMLGLLRTPITFDNSNGNSKPWDDVTSYQFESGKQRNYRNGGGYDNPFWTVNKNPFNDKVNRLIQNVQGSYKFSSWVTLAANIGVDTYSDRRQQIFSIGSRAYPTGRIIEDNFNITQTDAYLTVNGKGYLNKSKTLDIAYNGGINSFTYSLNNLRGVGANIAFDGFNSVANTTQMNISRSLLKNKSVSAFASVDLGYKSMFYLTLTGRQDYDSRFVSPEKSFKLSDIGFFYPSVSTSWVFSELIKNKKILSFGKLRASFAQIAKGPGNAYATSTTYQQAGTGVITDGWTNGVSFPNNGQNAYLLGSTAGNPYLVPEKTNDFEVGTNLAFFNRRIIFDAAYYNRSTNNAIVPATVSGATGFNAIYLNTGKLHTNGVDISLTGVAFEKEKFNWSISSTFTKYVTIVDKLSDGLDQLFIAGFTGSAIYHIPGYQYGQIFGGDFARDASGNLVIDDDPTSSNYGYPLADPKLKVIGNPNPKFIMGITNNFKIKNFDISFLFDMKVGGEMWNGTQGALTFFGMSEETENRGESTTFSGVGGHYDANGNLVLSGTNTQSVVLDQNWYQGNGGGFGNVAKTFVQDASTYRLRNLTVAYTFNSFKKGKIKEVRLSLTGNNLLLFTPYKGIDPETSLVGSASNGQGLDYFNMPNTRSYTFGVNVKI